LGATKSLSVDGITKLWNVQTMGYFSEVKQNGLSNHGKIRRNLKSMELIFLKSVNCVLIHSFASGCPIVPAALNETVFAPWCCICAFVKDKPTIFTGALHWALYSVPLTYLSILSPKPHCLDYCSFTVSAEVG